MSNENPTKILPALITVDIVVLTIIDADLKVLLIKRKDPPFAGSWALPGGFLRSADSNNPDEKEEDLDNAAIRELKEETNLPIETFYLEQFHTFSTPNRDPRSRVITVGYYALIKPNLAPLVYAGGDASHAQWHSISELSSNQLAFDHESILNKSVEFIRHRIDHTAIAFELIPPTFTITELRSVYEVIKGTKYDRGNFRRRFHRFLDDQMIELAPGKRITGTKPAAVYRFKSKT